MAKHSTASLSKTVKRAYEEAAPYLVNSEWLKGLLDIGLRKAETFDALTNRLEKEWQMETDVAKQADLKIYLAYLKKLGSKS